MRDHPESQEALVTGPDGTPAGSPPRAPGRRWIGIGWLAVFAAIVGAGAAIVGSGRAGPAALGLVALSLATLALRYGLGWRGLPWPATLSADLAVALALLNSAGQQPSEPPALAMTALAALLLGHAGSFGVRTLVLGFEVRTFEYLQNAMLLALALGGAALLGMSPAVLGTAALVLAVLAYALAFLVFERRAPEGANYPFYAAAGLALALVGAWLAVPAGARGPALAVLGLVAALAARRHARHLLVLHGSLLALVGVGVSVLGPGGPAATAVSLLVACATAVVLTRRRAPRAVTQGTAGR